MVAPTDRHALALQRFLAERPALGLELAQLNPLAAQARRESLEKFRQEHLHAAFEAEAQAQGLFAWELTLKLTAASPAQYLAQRLEVHRESAQMAGIEWDQYRRLYGLEQ